MSRKLLLSAIAALTVGTLVAAVPQHAGAGTAEPRVAHAGPDQAQYQIYGPYATMRRANEVANEFRSLGFNAFAYPNGDAYYVRVW